MLYLHNNLLLDGWHDYLRPRAAIEADVSGAELVVRMRKSGHEAGDGNGAAPNQSQIGVRLVPIVILISDIVL